MGAVLLLLHVGAFSQINTYSPYSRFGLGQLAKTGLGQSSAMGLTGIALRTNEEINYLNPAGYSAIDTMSFIFDFGITGSSTTYISDEGQTKLNNFNIKHIAIGFPVTHWWKAAVGITPYSVVGYNILEHQEYPWVGGVDYYYSGNGGLNKFFIGSSFTVFKKLTLGVNMSTLFGFIENKQRAEFNNDTRNAVTSFDLRDDIGGIQFNLGAQYHQTVADKYFITLAAIFDNESKINISRTYLVTNQFPGTDAARSIQIDTISPYTGNDTTVMLSAPVSTNLELENDVRDGKIVYPQNFGLGIAFGIKNKLTITGDYYSRQWSNGKILGKSDSLTNSRSYRFGMQYVPDPAALKGYLNHVRYRLGGYYTNSYIRIRGEQINDYGITFGMGLPFKNTKTTFNLGVVLGQRGTLNNNLIKENYGIVNFSLVLHDFWFFKRKFD